MAGTVAPIELLHISKNIALPFSAKKGATQDDTEFPRLTGRCYAELAQHMEGLTRVEHKSIVAKWNYMSGSVQIIPPTPTKMRSFFPYLGAFGVPLTT